MNRNKPFALSLLFIVVLGFVFTPPPASALNQKSKIDIPVQEFFLDNGMQFLIVQRKTTPQVACRVAIRAGSALEESGKTGVAHMLEHMMFKGTKNFGTTNVKEDQKLQHQIEDAYQIVLAERQKRHPDQKKIDQQLALMQTLREKVKEYYVPHAFSLQLGKNGAVDVNAFTTTDQTQFTMSIPSDMIEQWFSIVSEQLFEPSWREFYVEKEVVKREWGFRFVNSPSGAAWLDLASTAFTAHPYRNPTIGWKSDIDRFSTEDAIEFHKKYYNPTNAVCVLAGDIDLDTAKHLANIYFGRYPAGKRAPEIVTTEPKQEGPRKSVRYLKGAKTPVVRIGYHAARMGTKDFYALDALNMILSAGRGARMFRNIVQKGLAVEAWGANPDNRYGGLFVLGGSPIEPKELAKKDITDAEKQQAYYQSCESLEKMLIEQIDKLKHEKVSDQELRRIKKLNQRDFLDRLESNEALAGTLATIEVQTGWRYFQDYLKNMDQITADDVMRVANKYFDDNNKTSVYILPGGVPDKPPVQYSEVRSFGTTDADEISTVQDLSNHSIYPTPKGWKHPLSFVRTPKKMVYPKADQFSVGKATTFYIKDTELPLIDLVLHIKAGAVDIDKDKTGLDDVLSQTIIEGGTDKYSPSEMAMVLDENAIQLSVNIGEESSTVHLSVMTEDWDKGIEILKDVLTKPRFDAEIFEAAKNKDLIGLQRQSDNPHALAMREGIVWHFKGHPYGRDPLMGLKTIPDLTPNDCRQFLKTYFVPENIVAGISGDIDKKMAQKGLGELMAALPGTKAPKRNLTDPKSTPPVIALIDKPGQVQSQVAMFLPSVKRTNPEFWKMSLLMDLFGGNDSMLFKRLRDDLGLVYSTWFYQTYKWRAGMLVGFIGCKGDKTKESIQQTMDIMDTLHQDIPSKQLELKRLDLLNSFVFNVDTPAQLVDVYCRYEMRHEPLNTLDVIQDQFISAKRNELKELAQKLLKPKHLQIFVVADANIRVKNDKGQEITLKQDLMDLAQKEGVPFKQIALR